MLKNPEYRARARAALGENIFSAAWLMSLVVVLISVIPSFVAEIPFVGFIAFFIVSGPLQIGVSSYYLKLTRNGEADPGTVFDGFKNNFGDHILLEIMRCVFVFLWTLLFIIPGIVKTYAYSMAYYIKNDHPEYSWKQCLDESQRIMRGNKWRLFCLQLSFIGWIIVGLLCLGVGTYWVNAYMCASQAEFYNNIKDN